jgi:hypothetical protein
VKNKPGPFSSEEPFFLGTQLLGYIATLALWWVQRELIFCSLFRFFVVFLLEKE